MSPPIARHHLIIFAACRPCTTCSRKGYQCVDRVCSTCIQQGLDGECPHRSIGQEDSTSDGDGSGGRTSQPTSTESTNSAPHPFIPPLSLPIPSQTGITSGMFSSRVYGPSPYHILAVQHASHGPGEGSSSGYPRAPYYPVIDPQIDVPQPNISSERYDPSSAPSSAAGSSS